MPLEPILALKFLLIPLAAWRLWRLMAIDTLPANLGRKFRQRVGVHYYEHADGSLDYSRWWTKDGSFAEGLTCIYCGSVWWAEICTVLLIFLPSWLFIDILAPLNISALVIFIEKIHSKGDKNYDRDS